MTDIFKLTYKVGNREFPLYFDSQDRAERFRNVILEIATDRNHPAVHPKAEIIKLIDSDADIVDAAKASGII